MEHPPHPPTSLPVAKTPPYLPSRSGKLSWPQEGGMTSSTGAFQRDRVQTSSASSRNSGGKSCEGDEAATKSPGSFFLMLHFQKIFQGRQLIWDAAVAMSPPDVILSDWGSNSRDYFWAVVTHDCACATAKLSIATFPSLCFFCRGLGAFGQMEMQ